MSKGTLKNYNNVERLKSFGKAFITEGGQEAAASIAQDLIARGTYSDQLPIGESLVEELFMVVQQVVLLMLYLILN